MDFKKNKQKHIHIVAWKLISALLKFTALGKGLPH